MSRDILSLSTMALALLLLSGVALAQPAPRQVPDASCKRHGPGVGLEPFSRSTALAAQTFKAEHTGHLTKAEVQVVDRSRFEDRSNEPIAIVMEIRTVDSSGTPTEVVKASTKIPASEVSDGHIRVATGYFRPGAQVEAGKQYALVLYPPLGERSVGEAPPIQGIAQAWPLVLMSFTWSI